MLNRGLAALDSHPVQGYGPGMAASKIGRLPGASGLTIDSYFLSVALDSGYLGLLLFSSSMLIVLYRGMRAGVGALGVPSWTLIALSTGILASLIVKLVLSLVDNEELLFLLIAMTFASARLVADCGSPASTTSLSDRAEQLRAPQPS
jgi:hypothetical protein